MAGKIFINYRRDDDPGYTQALYQRLEGEFASDDLFYDIEGHHIRPGDDLRIVLNEQVARSRCGPGGYRTALGRAIGGTAG